MSASSSRPLASSVDGGRGRRSLIAGVVAGTVVLDQLTKHWAVNALDDGRRIDLVGSLRLRLTSNSGASFSFGEGRGGLIALVGLVVVAFVFRSAARWPGRLAPIALGLVLGGAVGNLVDRVFRGGEGFLGGHVIDFIDPQFWPVFNVADIGISCGAVLLALVSLRHEERT